MKTTLYCIITLLILLGQITLPNSFAQEVLPEPSVRLIYFLPKGHAPSLNIDEKIDPLIKDVQELYADQMELHGFGRKTFRLETDKTGRVVVHRVNGKFRDSHYAGDSQVHYMCERIAPEVSQQFDASNNIYLIVTDFTQSLGGYALGEFIVTTPNLDPKDDFIMTAHELGHSFGLGHDFRNGAYIMSYGVHPDRLSKCAARWLDAHRFFNTPVRQINTNATIQMHPPTLAPPDAIRLRFEVNDPDGLHQANLLILGNGFDGVSGFKFDGCHFFEHGSNTIEFVSTELIEDFQDQVFLYVMDKHGGITSQAFPIDISGILPPPNFVSIPDPNLAAAIREVLGFGENDPISQRAVRSLNVLDASDRQIKNLSGLEHATQLESLYLGDFDGNDGNNNNVSDLTPLKNLTQLKQLWLGINNVSDITPLKNLTELVSLILFSNNVSDLTPLKNLTQLKQLKLGRNPISDLTPLRNLTKLDDLSFWWSKNVSDLTPLRNLTQLKVLTLGGNTISDFTPLRNLTKLEYLTLSSSNVSDITVLAKMPQLKVLNLDRNPISDLTPLRNLTKLEYLNLSFNNVSDITPLINLTGLETLRLEGNPIRNHARLLTLLKKNPDMKIYLKEGGDPLPVTLSHFRAEQTPTGVVLKWITESEVDNAGFYILRSENRDSTFKVVNPMLIQGAGTTSEKHTYTWTDTTAKPNVAYFYRIEDISHAGVRKQLATVRMRGFVSASGKLTTMWADLKTPK